MKNVNWNDVQDDIRRPVAGGYAARITNVVDHEDKEYLWIEWDFADGEFKGCNRETFDAFGFWPSVKIQSYKSKALRFFKSFKTCVEKSNRNYTFDCMKPAELIGKYVGVVLGEEEYLSKDGSVKTRLYVDSWQSGQAIRDGDYRIPALKKLDTSKTNQGSYSASGSDFSVLEDDDEDMPF